MFPGGNYSSQHSPSRTGEEAAIRCAIADAPATAALHLALGDCLLLQQRRGEALDAYLAAAALAPALVAAHLGVARCETDPLRRYHAFAEVARLEPTCHESVVGIADCLIDLGQGRDAIDWLWTVVQEAPGDLALASAAGDLLLTAGRPTEAAEFFERAIAEHPIGSEPVDAVAGTYRGLARALGELGRHGEATEALQAAIYLKKSA
jgi:tetratricopeptide (TPR) repeat protein